jgi:hypothetical protein
MSVAVQTIRCVLAAGVLMPELVCVAKRGATPEEIEEEERLLPRPLSRQHRAVLETWNGLDLEVIRLYGCHGGECVDRLSDRQDPRPEGDGILAIGSSPEGTVYAEALEGGIVLALDVRTGRTLDIATSLDDFFGRCVFGPDAASFAGEDWASELRAARIW